MATPPSLEDSGQPGTRRCKQPGYAAVSRTARRVNRWVPSVPPREVTVDGKAPGELRSHRDGIGRLTLPRRGEASHSACRCVTVREEASGSRT